MTLVVWTGPVAKAQVPGATVAGAAELFINCCGDLTPPCTPPTCPEIGDALMGSPDALLSRAGVSAPGDVLLAAFSAGGSILKRVLENPDYRSMATAVHLADAMWTASWKDQALRLPPSIEGFVRYAADVANGPGDKLFVATSSPNVNGSWAAGIENLMATASAIEERTGRSFTLRPDFFGIDPAPVEVRQLGNVIFASYPAEPLGHEHTKIAGQVWQNIIVPWLAKGKGPVDEPGPLPFPGPEPPSPGPLPPLPGAPAPLGALRSVVLFGLGAVGGYFIARALRKG